MSLAHSLAVAVTGLATTAHATAVPPSPVVVVVKVARPWYAFDFLVTGKMRDAVPQYAALSGLVHKSFSFARPGGEFGGLYLWSDRASADAWFSPKWFDRVERERGMKNDVRVFEAPFVYEPSPSPPGPVEGRFAGVIVLSPSTPEARRSEARRAAESLRTAPGLVRAYALVSDDGRAGALSEWSSRSAAEAALAQVGHPGDNASVEWFDVPIALSNTPIAALVPATAEAK